MNKLKKKEKREIPVRLAGETIVKSENRPSKVLFDLAVAAEQNETPPPYHPLPPLANKKNLDVSPKRDYTKVANSINRDAVPSGLFKGTSKNTYDVLYQKTRGAIIPTRTLKAIQSDLQSWTNLSHNTLRSHLKHLQSVGLVEVHYKLGDNAGAEYEIFLPEEIDLTPYHPLPPPTTPQNVVGGTYQNLLVGGGRLMPENNEETEFLRHSLKTNTNDDEAFAPFIEKFQAAAKELTGKNLSVRDRENLEKFADLLILELKIAARRTGNISSVPAFLTEVLRRKLRDIASPTVRAPKVKPDTVGKADAETYEIKALDEAGREAALDQLREFAGDDFLGDFKKWYTEEDWTWLTKELETEQREK